MNLTKTIKTGAIAAVVLFATAGASMAATYAWVDHDAKVKKHHTNASLTVNYIHEGQQVKIIGSWGNWYKIQIPGKDGWVKQGALDFHPWGGSYGGSFCINGDHASFCINGGY